MPKAMTATQVIVSLALGLIVIVGLGYLVWTWIIHGEVEANLQYCKTQAFTYCSQARVRTPSKNFFELKEECKGIYPSSDIAASNAKESTICKEILGISITSTT